MADVLVNDCDVLKPVTSGRVIITQGNVFYSDARREEGTIWAQSHDDLSSAASPFALQNKCVPYWPNEDETKEYGKYVVSPLSERAADDYKVRVLEVVPIDGVHASLFTRHPHHITSHTA